MNTFSKKSAVALLSLSILIVAPNCGGRTNRTCCNKKVVVEKREVTPVYRSAHVVDPVYEVEEEESFGEKVKDAALIVRDKAGRAKDAVVDTACRAKDAVVRTAGKAKDTVVDTARTVRDKASEKFTEAKHDMQERAQANKNAANRAAARVNDRR